MAREKACVAFGSFEFVHRGHVKVAERVKEIAAECDLKSVIFSFPKDGEVYTTEKEKEYLLKKIGIEEVVTCKEKQDLEQFIIYIKNEFGAQCIVVGENNLRLTEIRAIAERERILVDVVETVSYEGEPVSYDILVKCFEEKNFELLTEICGHPYILMGDVVHGKKLGRTVGMPTINLHIYKTKKRPASGVYATRVNLGKETYKSATNIGKRPTVDDFDYITIETFIIDFNRQIYGEICVLEVHKYLREVKKFDSLEQVQLQVQKDKDQVTVLLS